MYKMPASTYTKLIDESDDEMAFVMKATIKEQQRIPEMQNPKQNIGQVKRA